MGDFYQSCLYQNVVRCPKKSLTHCCTGETELQRIAKNLFFPDLQYSLTHSKMLRTFIQKYPLDEKFNDQGFEQLCHIKNITNEQNKFYLRKALSQYQCYKYSATVLERIRKIKYDKANQMHEKLLLELWANLMPKQPLTDRISDQWITVGFQANDPATDFRGAGYLGLSNLVEFSRNKKCMGVFKWAINQDTTYFFCSAGLFFTMMGIELMKEMRAPVEFWYFKDDEEILGKYQILYNMLFLEFDEYWKSVENKSILQFNNNLNKFKERLRARTPEYIKERMIFWEQV